ncbi:MAG: hypothetical protein AB9866_18800 [Syntrophobacteraceae bacterium]
MKTLSVGRSEQSQSIRISSDMRFKHMYLVGKTGAGKTSLILDFIRQDSYGDHAMVFLDVKGEEALKALGVIDETRTPFVDYCSTDHPLSLNPLKHPYKRRPYTDHDKHVVFETLAEIINQAMSDITGQVKLTGGMRDLLRPWIMSELDEKHPSLDRVFQKILLDIADDKSKPKGVPRKYHGDDAQTVYRLAHRLSEVLADEYFNKIVSGEDPFDWDEFLEKGRILIINAHGMTPHQQKFLGNIITKQLTSYFMHAEKEIGQFPPCALFLDEFEAFVNSDFLSILRRARSFNFSCLLSHQDHANIHGSPMFQRILHSILSNAGTLMAFRIGAHESGMLSKEFTNKKFYDFKDADDYTLCIRVGKEESLVKVSRPPLHDEIKFIKKPRQFQIRWGWHEA